MTGARRNFPSQGKERALELWSSEEDATCFTEFVDQSARARLVTSMVGVHRTQRIPETCLYFLLRRLDGANRKSQNFESPRTGIGDVGN